MSFFKKQTKEEPTFVSGILATGGKVDEVIVALVEAANDADPRVRASIAKSILEIGKKQPDLVLSTCNDHLLKNLKTPREHRIILLNSIYQILELQRSEVTQGLMFSLINMAINEMTIEKQEIIPDWQGGASAVLVSLGIRFPNEILDELMKRFSPGTVPHYFIMKTLGDFIFANALETVPRLKEVIARVLPVLASIKHENMKWVFASGLGKFCDAILTYVANTKENQFTVYSFSSDIYPAYEILFSTWLQSKEPKVRLATIQALGSMCAVLAREQLEAQLPRLIPTLLAFYKKEKDLLPITQGFTNILEVAMKDGNRALDPLLPQIFATIHPLACIIPDYTNSHDIKNYNELLRCFQTISMVFSDSVITYLLERINNKDVRMKIGTIAIIRHLVTHNVEQLDDKRGLLVSGIKPLCNTEPSWTVKKELSQIIIAMASYGYLQLEGGESLVEFIIKNCSIPDEEIAKYEKDKKKDPSATTPSELRSLCDNILNLATTTIDAMHVVLWPYLLETIVIPQYSSAMGIITKCLAHIASLKREQDAEDYLIDFDRAPNLPKPQAIMARLLVMVNAPNRRNQLGMNTLLTLKNIGPILHPSICEMWDNAIPKLITYLETNSTSWNQSVWEELILRLLSETVKIANDDEWTNVLGDQLTKQFDLYNDDSDMKRIAFKHLGLVLQKTTHKESIRNKLETMLLVVNSNNEAERLGCAQGFGYCGATHLDMTLEKVQNAGKGGNTPTAPKKSGGGLLGLFSGSKNEAPDTTTTLILAYGYITAYASPTLITSRIDISIINHLKPTMVKAKSAVVKECIITTIDLIGKAMHSSHLKKEYVFKQRDDLLKQLLIYMTQTGSDITNQIRILGLNACATLINLDPVLSEELESGLLEKIVPFFAISGQDSSTQQIMDNMNTVFGNILLSQPSLICLCRLFRFIEPWICSKDGSQRERACNSVIFLLKKTVELKTKEGPERREKSFTDVGHCIAMLIPRCTDPIASIRQTAIEAIQTCLFIDYIVRLPQDSSNAQLPQELLPFKTFKERITTEELNEQFSAIHEMSRVLSVVTTKEELPELLLSSLKGLNDSQLSSTSGTCVVLNGLIKARGVELLPKVSQIVAGLLSALEGINHDQTMNGTLHALRSLASHHEIPVVNELLKAPVPHSNFVCKALQAIAKDENLVMTLIQHLFEIINNSQLYEERHIIDPKTKKNSLVACHIPMSATCAIGELLQLEELEDVLSENYPLFLGSLLLRIGTAYGMTEKTPSDQIATTLRNFISCGKETMIETVMAKKNSWDVLGTAEYHRAITDISGAVCKSHPTEMDGVYNFLYPFLKGNFVGQRIVAATVLAEFINHCQNNQNLLSKLVTCILSSLRDPTIKLQSLIGLGNIVAVGTEEANQYAPTVLDALMSSIDDQNEILALEAMNGLSKVFKIVEESRISPILVNVCHRIKPAFDKENNEVRTAAFTLFGALHRFGCGSGADAFYEQIHDNLPSLILHLNDENSNVSAACKNALRDLAPLFRSKEMEELFTSSTLDPNRSLDYSEFTNDLSIRLINSYPQRINYYVMTCIEHFKSSWNIIKANAVICVGFLLGNMSIEKRKSTNLNPGLITRAMILLLKERAPEVRKSCSDAMSLLHSY